MAIKSFRSRSLAFIGSAIFVIASSGKAFPQDSKDYWSEFRQQYPFHFQELLISNPDTSGQRSLIISEPPPGFLPSNAEQIFKDCFGSVYGGFKTKQHPLGFNGWVRDYVVTLTSPTGETQEEINRQVDDGIAALSYSLYGTTYKAHALQLPLKQSQKFDEAPPSLSISPGELRTWLTDSNRAFVSVDTSQPTTLKSILDSKFTGVFLSQKPGLALLVLHRSEDLAKHWSDLRKFALDSDLILGSIVQKNDDALVIVGRERQTSLSAMPPLRAETIVNLAATTNQELYQSINGQGSIPLTGTIHEGEFKGKDWNLASLSENLIDTEFGSLLDITDELLKNWSEAGNLETVRLPYPKPSVFPFKGKSLLEQVGGYLVYNWNTKGLGAVYNFGSYEVFAVTKTGSLPVSYIPEAINSDVKTKNTLTKFEDEGYDYFSGQRNVHLSQVVSYTTLYQIFRAFPFKNVTWKKQVTSDNYIRVENELFFQTLLALKQIKIDAFKVKTILKNLGYENDVGLTNVLQYIRSLDANELEVFAKSLSRDYVTKFDRITIRKLNGFLGDIIGKNKALENLVSVSNYEPNSNIKTPAIVVSRYVGKNIIGGHNLDSTVTKFILDSNQSRGTVNINKSTGELRIHPDDAINSKSVARFYSRNKTQFDSQQQFQIPPVSASPRSSSDSFSSKRVDNIPGLSLRSEVPDISKNNVGFQSELIPIGEDGMRQITELAQGRNLDLYVEQLQDGFAIYRGHPPGFIHASSPSALLEILSSSGSMWTKKSGRIYFNNFSEGSIEGIKQSLTVRTQSNDGGLLSQLLPSRKSFFSKNNDSRRWNFDLVPQEQGDFEVLKVSRKQEGERPRNIFSKIRLNEKPDWSKATITRLENLPNSITQSQKPGLIGMSYQVTLPVLNKKPIDLLVNPFLKRSWTPEDISLGETTIQNSLNHSAANNATFEQGLVNLKKELQERLTPADLEFFYKEGLDGMIIIRKDSEDNAS